MVEITILDNHDRIGVDFDGTLIDEPNSKLLVDYIVKNHVQKEFYIVTFRTHGMQYCIWNELAKHHGTAIDRDMFKGVFNMPDRMYENYADALHQRVIMRRAGLPIPAEIPPAIVAYRTWKGMMCQQHGITILVDDKPEDVELGCVRCGIDFLDIRRVS